MKCFCPLVLSATFVFLATSAWSVDPKAASGVSVTRDSGGSIRTVLSGEHAVNKESSLNREWITVHDRSVPADPAGTIGVTTIYVSGGDYVRGGYRYKASFAVDVKEPLAAIEVRFLTFDIWGNHVRTLNLTEVRDFPAGVVQLSAMWDLWSENDCSEFYASIAYVSRVRTMAGRVVEARIDPVLAEARKLSKKFTAENLEPKPEKKP